MTLENVSVLEAGEFCYDLSSGDQGKVVMKHCRADLAYNPVFNLTRGERPKDEFYELTILSPPEGSEPTPRTCLGTICGDGCTFILHDGMTRPPPAAGNLLECGGRHGLTNSTVKNYTSAKLVLNGRVRSCIIESVGPVEDGGQDNRVTKLDP